MGQPGAELRDSPTAATHGDHQPRILFTMDGPQPASVLPLVCDLVADADAKLVIGSPVVLPDQTPLGAPEPRREGERLAVQYVLKAKRQCRSDVSIEHATMTGLRRGAIIQTLIDRYRISSFVTEDLPRSGIRSLIGFEATCDSAVPESCNTIIVSRIGDVESIESILVPVARGPHSGYAVDIGMALARQNGATLELLHIYLADDEDGLSNGEEVLETASNRLNGDVRAEQTLLEAEDIPDAIIDHTRPFDITVFGAPREGKLRRFILGTIPETVSEEAEGTVLIAHRGRAEESWLDRWI